MKKFLSVLSLITVLGLSMPAFAAPPPPPPHHGGHGGIHAGAHYGHRPLPPPRYHHRNHAGFTIYTGYNRPAYYGVRDYWYDDYFRPVRYFPTVNTGFYISF